MNSRLTLILSLVLTMSPMSYGNSCDDLKNVLATTSRIDENIERLKQKCIDYQTAKQNFINIELTGLINEFPRTALNSANLCLTDKFKQYSVSLLSLAKSAKQILVIPFTDLSDQLQPYKDKLATLSSSISQTKQAGLPQCYGREVTVYLSKLDAANKSYPEDVVVQQIVKQLQNKISDIEAKVLTFLAPREINFKRDFAAINAIFEHKLQAAKETEYAGFKSKIKDSIQATATQMYSLQYFLEFLVQIDQESRFKEAQLKALVGMADIGVDDMTDLLNQLYYFKKQSNNILAVEAQNALKTITTNIEEVKATWHNVSVTDKDKRLLVYLNGSIPRLAAISQKCGSQFLTFNKRYALYKARASEVLEAYKHDVDEPLLSARHRFSEAIIQDAYYLFKLCKQGDHL